jgi:hypothetical protein
MEGGSTDLGAVDRTGGRTVDSVGRTGIGRFAAETGVDLGATGRLGRSGPGLSWPGPEGCFFLAILADSLSYFMDKFVIT